MPANRKQTKRPTKTATRRVSPRRATAGKEHPVKGARPYFSEVVGGLDSLPRFLLAADIAALLNVSKTESYRIARACGVTRLGDRKRLVRVARARFLRYLAERMRQHDGAGTNAENGYVGLATLQA